ncbi:Major facilitator superfamily domain,Major facilitator superfamily associated domain [Cinara cedri]|uniref:Major facilitator superfamily domain,Major facilitator superfamily associated domain n=1 Tax=Cinara cedri TaxID=506608 RepID=A0A5E4MVX8_9HEMI|nr:Major facilitator superfamily domain,Major facilitator superfamily associated domain [Cinara cedri]
MFSIKVNRKLLPLKICYFLMFACLAPIIGFLPTFARQLGYSFTIYGVSMTIIYLSSTVWTMLVGVLVDKFRVKKKLFTAVLLGMGVASAFFMLVPKVPLDAVVELKCLSETVLTATFASNDQKSPDVKPNVNIGLGNKLMMCKLDCKDTVFYGEKSEECVNWMASANNGTDELYKYKHIDATIELMNRTETTDDSYGFRLLSAQVVGIDAQLSTNCSCPLKSQCRLVCNDEAVMEATKTYRGNVLGLYQFWIFFITLNAYFTMTMLSSTLINPICLDILGDKSVDFGKQKLWASFGWGTFSILIGWIVDLFSYGQREKDYSPIFVSCIILTVLNLIVTTQIEVVEVKKSNKQSMWKTVFGLFAKHYVVIFIAWSAICTFLHAIITHYLFWYMEDMVSAANDQVQLAWLKTLQGLAQGVQCFGGEIPFLFWSGWIIKKAGYVNCMALVLGTMAIRMYLYTVISNPAWIVLIELLNGVSYALGFALKMSYAKTIAPPDTLNTIIACITLFDCIGESLGSLMGGFVFDSYGGVWAFRFFACCSALACCLNVVLNFFGLTRDTTTIVLNIDEKPTKTDENKETCSTVDADHGLKELKPPYSSSSHGLSE